MSVVAFFEQSSIGNNAHMKFDRFRKSDQEKSYQNLVSKQGDKMKFMLSLALSSLFLEFFFFQLKRVEFCGQSE